MNEYQCGFPNDWPGDWRDAISIAIGVLCTEIECREPSSAASMRKSVRSMKAMLKSGSGRDAKAERLAVVTDEAIQMFNSSRLVKQNGGLLAAVHPTVGRANRQAQVKRCIKVARDICKAVFKSDVITQEFWMTFWDECWQDEFMSGRGEKSRQHANWLPDMEYLTRPATMLKVFEKAMANQEVV